MALLGLFTIALTGAVFAKFSVNILRVERARASAQVLQEAKNNLAGYAIRQVAAGTLPCPDTSAPADGLEDRVGNSCSATLGRLPYRTLGIDDLSDASGTLLWYAVAPAYTDIGLGQRNSSIANNYSLNGVDFPAIVISPGQTLNGQVRNNFTVANYLEGENANASVDTYAQVSDDTHNDFLAGINTSQFWPLMEKRVLSELSTLLRNYKTACAEFPWAADFAVGADDSIDLLQSGSFPFGTALPADWNTGCALGLQPTTAMRTHWQNQIYYHFCTTAEGSCLNVTGDLTQSAVAILLAPGVAFGAQTRTNYTLADYFETENANGDTTFQFLQSSNFNGTFNDSLNIVEP